MSTSAQALATTEAHELEHFPMYIGGQFVDAVSGETFASVNPTTGRAWATAPAAAEADVDRAVRAARDAFTGPWGRTTGPQRAKLMRRLGVLVEAQTEHLARIESTDNGKLLRETLGVVAMLPDYCTFFAGVADQLTGATIPTSNPDFFVYTQPEPLGVVAAIVPWNNPLVIMMIKIAPAIAAGCSVVLKTSEATPASSIEFARLFQDGGFPDGVLNIISGVGPVAGRSLVRHPGVDKVSFTGSSAVGASVAQEAGAHLAEVALELGGKSPNVVFADADLTAAANGVVGGIFASTGQMCIAGSRLLVERTVADEFVRRLSEAAARIRIGDPLDIESEMGPLATEAQFEKVRRMCDAAVGDGAQLAHGGRPTAPAGLEDGFFFEPTIFTGVSPDMPIAQDEVFGPVLAVIPFDTEEEAVALANDTPYGLAAGVWTSHGQRAHRMANAIRAGTVWVNCYRNAAPNVPFGGFAASGFSRENGAEAVRAFTHTKSVWMELAGTTRDPFKMPAFGGEPAKS